MCPHCGYCPHCGRHASPWVQGPVWITPNIGQLWGGTIAPNTWPTITAGQAVTGVTSNSLNAGLGNITYTAGLQ